MYKTSMNDKVTDPCLLNGNWPNRAVKTYYSFMPYHNNELELSLMDACLFSFVSSACEIPNRGNQRILPY